MDITFLKSWESPGGRHKFKKGDVAGIEHKTAKVLIVDKIATIKGNEADKLNKKLPDEVPVSITQKEIKE